MKKLTVLTFTLLFILPGYSQNVSGKWKGEIDQAPNHNFVFEIEISEFEGKIYGYSKLTTGSGQTGEFKLKGFFDGSILYFTETKQLTTGNYCKKFAKLTMLPNKNNDKIVLEGPWNSYNCNNVGNIKLEQKEVKSTTIKNIASEKLSGTWTGDLVQEGVIYDFYYKLTIPQSNKSTGMSYAVIEEHGSGSVNQLFNYVFDEKENKLLIEEYKIIYRDGQPQNWCIKDMELDLREENDKYVLEGDFWGIAMNGKTCNPGTIYLEKPKLESKEKISSSINRNLNVTKSFKSDSEDLVIKFWDAGKIDNDIVSIYLNDNIIIDNVSLKREKEELKIKLDEDKNYLIFYAENLGDIPPNTAAFEIEINGKKETFKMNADLKNSDVILIRK